MTYVTCRLTAKNRDQLRNPALGNRVWATDQLSIEQFSATPCSCALPEEFYMHDTFVVWRTAKSYICNLGIDQYRRRPRPRLQFEKPTPYTVYKLTIGRRRRPRRGLFAQRMTICESSYDGSITQHHPAATALHAAAAHSPAAAAAALLCSRSSGIMTKQHCAESCETCRHRQIALACRIRPLLGG